MASVLRRRTRRLLIDVDTQFDLLSANGQGFEGVLRNIRRVVAWARKEQIPIISTVMVRRIGDAMILDGRDVCIEGTSGQQKIPYTLVGSRIVYGPEAQTDMPRHILREYRQVIFEKCVQDPFSHPRADRLLSEVRADEFIVFGMGLETAIKATVLGLQHRKKSVTLITDASCVGGDDKRAVSLALRQMEAKGAKLTVAEQLVGRGHLVGRTCGKRLILSSAQKRQSG